MVTTEGLPLAYEVLAGNTRDCTTLQDFLARIERQYGKARRVWCMDRGVPTEEVLAQMRASDPPVQYLVGTPKGRLTRLEQALLDQPWHAARPGVQVKLLAQDDELYVLAESRERIGRAERCLLQLLDGERSPRLTPRARAPSRCTAFVRQARRRRVN